MKTNLALPLRRDVLNIVLVLLFLASIAGIFVSSTDAKQIIFDLSIGMLVSLLIYFLVVVIPEHQKRAIIKRNLRQQYDSFKEDCIYIFFNAMKESPEPELVSWLKDQTYFREYFHEKVTADQERWHAVVSGLSKDEALLKDLVVELEILMKEVEYTLSAIDIDHAEAFALLKRLSQFIYRSKNWSNEYDDLKKIARFMWSLHTGWDWVKGYTDKDVIADMIRAI